MVTIPELWLPILLSAVVVFFVSFLIHAILNVHFNDFAGMPKEDAVADAIRASGAAPGDYVIPKPARPADMASDPMKAKLERGPLVFMTVMAGMPNMGKQLGAWFVYCVAVGACAAYVAGRTLAPGVDYLAVFRVVGTVAFLTYAGSEPIQSIWFHRRWSSTLKHMGDGLVYALFTAGMFGWLWPS